jgi:hypothetical protein
MATFKLARHYDSDCSYRVTLKWRDILRRLYYHVPDEGEGESPTHGESAHFVVDHTCATLYVWLFAPPEAEDEDSQPNPFRKLPIWLAEQCDDLKDLAQAADAFAETPWSAFGASLMMWKSGLPWLDTEQAKRHDFHAMRHTFATLLLEAGVNVKTAPEWLGHSSIAVTLRIYGHVAEKMRGDALAYLNAIAPPKILLLRAASGDSDSREAEQARS